VRRTIPRPVAPAQLHLALFAPHEIRVWEQEQGRRLLRQQRSGHPPRRCWLQDDSATRGLFEAIDRALLQLPLGGLPGGNELDCAADAQDEDAFDQGEQTRAAADGEAWSDAAVEQLHEAVLRHSLKALQARGNGAEKREILQWIFAPQPMVAVLRDARGQTFEAVLPQSITPFSFVQCCRICGYSAERLRDGLMPLLRERGLGNVFNEIANGPKQHETDGCPEALPDPGDLQHAAGLRGG
jgi:hypothetical protein